MGGRDFFDQVWCTFLLIFPLLRPAKKYIPLPPTQKCEHTPRLKLVQNQGSQIPKNTGFLAVINDYPQFPASAESRVEHQKFDEYLVFNSIHQLKTRLFFISGIRLRFAAPVAPAAPASPTGVLFSPGIRRSWQQVWF